MSFAYDVKAELCKAPLSRGCCAVAEGCGVLIPEEIELTISPCLSCDRQGNRLGQGGGYYDRFFAGRTGSACALVGLCYDFQTVGQVPAAPWDVRMTHVCTETRFSATEQG